MADYTTELYNVLNEFLPERQNPLTIPAVPYIVTNSWDKIFSYFPIWDESYRSVLCCKILSHYYFQEIGSETPALFVYRLNRKMNEIMPYYNQLYNTQIENLQMIARDIYEEYTAHENGNNQDTNTANRTTDTKNNTQRNENGNEISENQTGRQSSQDSSAETHGTTNSQTNETNKHTRDLIDSSKISGEETDNMKSDETITYNSTNTETKNLKNQTEYNSGTTRSGSDSTKTVNADTERFSDTPQGALTGIESNRYLTNATLRDADGTQTVTYGSREMKTGTDTLSETGTDTTKHTGTDTTETTSNNQKTNSSSETKNYTGTESDNNDSTTSGTTTENSTGHQSDTANEKQQGKRTNTLTSTDDFLGKILETSGYQNQGNFLKNNNYLRHTWGHDSTNWVDQILKWRDSLINIDMMIIDDLQPLFMGIW